MHSFCNIVEGSWTFWNLVWTMTFSKWEIGIGRRRNSVGGLENGWNCGKFGPRKFHGLERFGLNWANKTQIIQPKPSLVFCMLVFFYIIFIFNFLHTNTIIIFNPNIYYNLLAISFTIKRPCCQFDWSWQGTQNVTCCNSS